LLFAGIFAILYLLFNLYLVIHMAACMGNQRLMNSRVSIFASTWGTYQTGFANHKLGERFDTF